MIRTIDELEIQRRAQLERHAIFSGRLSHDAATFYLRVDENAFMDVAERIVAEVLADVLRSAGPEALRAFAEHVDGRIRVFTEQRARVWHLSSAQTAEVARPPPLTASHRPAERGPTEEEAMAGLGALFG